MGFGNLAMTCSNGGRDNTCKARKKRLVQGERKGLLLRERIVERGAPLSYCYNCQFLYFISKFKADSGDDVMT